MPLFGDIPVVGNLFKLEKSTRNKTELYIVITPAHRSSPPLRRATPISVRPVATGRVEQVKEYGKELIRSIN